MTTEGATAEEWDDAPTHPDPERDLGYRLLDWDVVRASNGSDRLIFLPQDDDMLRDDAFIIVDPDFVCDVDARQ